MEHITVSPRNDLRSGAIWKSICGELHNFKQVFDNNDGIYSAMNLGAISANGKFLVFWNAGEKITDLEQVMKLIQRLKVCNSPQFISQAEIEWLPGVAQNRDTYLGFLSGRKSMFISHQSYFVSREHFLKEGSFSSKFKVASDTELILRMSKFEIDFSDDICPVWVESSKFARLNHRTGRLENLRIAFKYLLKKRMSMRLPRLILAECFFVLSAASRLFELSAPKLRNNSRNKDSKSLHVPKNKNLSYGRVRVTYEFSKAIEVHIPHNLTIKVGIIGGSLDDYEVGELLIHSPKAQFTVLGIEGADVFMDLNQPADNSFDFDVVLVSQVLEHIWNHNNFFENIVTSVKKGGFIWVSCPASNKVHASPDYFSAGFTSQLIQNNFELRNVKSLSSGGFGTRRLYVATHLLPGWLTLRGHSCPLIYAFEERALFSRIILWIRYFPFLVFLSFMNAEDSRSERWFTESWWMGRRL